MNIAIHYDDLAPALVPNGHNPRPQPNETIYAPHQVDLTVHTNSGCYRTQSLSDRYIFVAIITPDGCHFQTRYTNYWEAWAHLTDDQRYGDAKQRRRLLTDYVATQGKLADAAAGSAIFATLITHYGLQAL